MIDRILTAALVAGMAWAGIVSTASAQTRSPGVAKAYTPPRAPQAP